MIRSRDPADEKLNDGVEEGVLEVKMPPVKSF